MGWVSVNMGPPQLDWAEVPLARAVDTLHLPLPGDPVAVGMGNPHCVFFVPDAEAVDLAGAGRAVRDTTRCSRSAPMSNSPALTGPDRLRMRVWERGDGHHAGLRLGRLRHGGGGASARADRAAR